MWFCSIPKSIFWNEGGHLYVNVIFVIFNCCQAFPFDSNKTFNGFCASDLIFSSMVLCQSHPFTLYGIVDGLMICTKSCRCSKATIVLDWNCKDFNIFASRKSSKTLATHVMT